MRLFAPMSSAFTDRAVRRLLTFFLSGGLLLTASQASAQFRTDEPDFLVLGAGAFDINDDMTAFRMFPS